MSKEVTPEPSLTIGELRKLIEGQPDDATVLLTMDDGCCGDFMDLTYSDSYSSLENRGGKGEPGYISIRARSVPGYSSCRQSSETQRLHEIRSLRGNTFVEKVLAGKEVDIKEEIKAHEARKDLRHVIIWDWLGFTPDQWHAYNEGTRTVEAIIRDIKEKRDDKAVLDSVIRKWGIFRMRLRNALSRGGWKSNPGATDEDICKAVEDLAERKILDATPVQKLTLEYLRDEVKSCYDCQRMLQIEANQKSDPESWDQSRIQLGMALAFEQMLGYTKGLNSGQQGWAKRKGKL